MRILIVEDEKKMAAVLKKGLEVDNHRVSLAFDGRSGLEAASSGVTDRTGLTPHASPIPE